ncbi:TAXI family TRAP transporter solute-binding subunit [Desulfobacula sp.]|uniref:TAXI family TRAP transporter solute-binding subunit n=1 Tax=Desulfobacula sp. TaxID=2593537 RepID=UPI00263582AC|nr:TAXI family TRAP transporter solute-binding subunit [Desulfobacula sp.]
MMKKKLCLRVTLFVITLGLVAFCGISSSHADQKNPYSIEISALWPGTSMYTNAVFWAKEINESDIGIKAIAREGKGPNVDMKTLAKYEKKRGHLIFFGVEDSWWGAQQGWKGWETFTKDYDFKRLRHLCMIGFTTDAMLAADPKIKTMYDMDGKTFVPATVGLLNAKAQGFIGTFNEAGIKPVFKPLGVAPMIGSLRDGLIDVIHGGISLVGPNQFKPSGYLNELFAVKQINLVSLDPEKAYAMKKKTGHPGTLVKFPSGAITTTQTEVGYGLGKAITWMCDVSVPDEIVTKMLTVYYKNINKFKEISIGGMILNEKTMAAIGVSEERFHPAALKFYKETNVPIKSLQDLGYLDK